MKTKEQRAGSLGMLLGKLGLNLLGNMRSGKCIIKMGDGVPRAGQDF